MKRLLKVFIILISLTAIFSFNKKKDLELDPESFLLGTLSDYMGRLLITNERDKIDNYGYYERSLVAKIDSLLIDNYSDLEVKTDEKETTTNVATKIYSKNLAEKINSNYTFSNYNLVQNKDTVFYGQLKPNILQTELQKISFIVGVYSRYGEEKNGKFCIKLLNSTSKFDTCEKVLKDLNCENIEKQFIKRIPLNQLLYFTPSKKLNKYLKNYIYLRDQIKSDQDKMFEKLMKKHK